MHMKTSECGGASPQYPEEALIIGNVTVLVVLSRSRKAHPSYNINLKNIKNSQLQFRIGKNVEIN